MAEQIDFTWSTKDNLLMGDVARESDAMNADIFVGDGTSSTSDLFGFGDTGWVEGFAEFAE